MRFSKKSKYIRLVIATFLFLIASILIIRISGNNINTTVLSMLQSIKSISGQSVNTDYLNQEYSKSINHSDWTSLLQKHVSESGLVNYRGFTQDSTLLNIYLEALSTTMPGRNWSEDEHIAYWINAYNAFTIQLVIRNYPVQSIKEIGGNIPMLNSPWDRKFFKIGSTSMDLNTIEHDILRRQFEEPRIHFAINCASISCPMLSTEAFNGEQLEEQLEHATFTFLRDPTKNKFKQELATISKIFTWFEADFTKTGSLIDFIAPYLDQDISRFTEIDYMDYDWNLNDRKL